MYANHYDNTFHFNLKHKIVLFNCIALYMVETSEYKYYKIRGGSIWFGKGWTVKVMQYNT